MTLWLNGERQDCAAISAQDRGFLLGDGLFETLRVRDGKPLLLARHLRRMAKAAERLKLPLCREDIAVWAKTAAAGCPSASLRITVTRGPGPRGLLPPSDPQPTVLISTHDNGPRNPSTAKVIISSVHRNAKSPTSQMKVLSYMDQVLARQEAQAAGAGDAIMLSTTGEAASTSMANLLALSPDGWITPPLSAGILPGIVREVLLERGAVQEQSISPADLQRWPLARSNSLLGVEPLTLEGGAAADMAEAQRLTAVLEQAESEEL